MQISITPCYVSLLLPSIAQFFGSSRSNMFSFLQLLTPFVYSKGDAELRCFLSEKNYRNWLFAQAAPNPHPQQEYFPICCFFLFQFLTQFIQHRMILIKQHFLLAYGNSTGHLNKSNSTFCTATKSLSFIRISELPSCTLSSNCSIYTWVQRFR